MEGLFSGPFDKAYTEHMYKVGDTHVKVKLPVEFMAGAMTLINNRLIELIVETYGDDKERCAQILTAVSAVTGMALLVMQQSYQASTLAEELERFLKISGMSRTLFANLANAYRDKFGTSFDQREIRLCLDDLCRQRSRTDGPGEAECQVGLDFPGRQESGQPYRRITLEQIASVARMKLCGLQDEGKTSGAR